MMKFIRNHKIIFSVVGLLLLPVIWFGSAYPRGMLVAEFDYLRGHYEIQTYGLPVAYLGRANELLEQNYGVSLHAIAGCVVTSDLLWYVDGYNSVSYWNLERKYGKDVVAESVNQAEKEWLD